MTLAILLIVFAATAMTVWYMRHPNYTRLRLSASRFLPVLPSPRSPRQRWSFGAPLMKWRFYLRVIFLCALSAACILPLTTRSGVEKVVRLALVIDISHSMSAQSLKGQPAELAARMLVEISDRLEVLAEEATVCVVLRFVGTGVEEKILANPSSLREVDVVVEHSGADAALLMQASKRESGECAPTHSVVLTDRPAPADITAQMGVNDIWLDLTPPADNVGFARISGTTSNFATPAHPAVEIFQYGNAPGSLTVEIETSQGQEIIKVDVDEPGPWWVPFNPRRGRVLLRLSPGGAYSGDDRIELNFEPTPHKRITWGIPVPAMPRIPGWLQIEPEDTQSVDLVVQPLFQKGEAVKLPNSSIPSILVYPGLGPTSTNDPSMRIGVFVEQTPLLNGVNLDVLEAAMRPLEQALPPGFTPVLRDAQGRAVLAIRVFPRAVIVPAPVSSAGSEVDKLGLTLFFNALRWTSGRADVGSSPHYVDDQGLKIPNANLEGDTAEPQRSVGSVNSIQPVNTSGAPEPFWPWLVALGAGVFVIERLVGANWRRHVL